eukprot:3384917-Amphidinium_carterae.2
MPAAVKTLRTALKASRNSKAQPLPEAVSTMSSTYLRRLTHRNLQVTGIKLVLKKRVQEVHCKEQSRKTAAKGSLLAVARSASAASMKASSSAPLPTGVSPLLEQRARQSVMRCFCHAAQTL